MMGAMKPNAIALSGAQYEIQAGDYQATVTELGTTAEVELLVRLTDSPPEGAALEIVTVPVEEAPPATEVGLKLTLLGVGAVIVRVAVLVPLRFAVIVALVLVATAVVVTVNVAVVA